VWIFNGFKASGLQEEHSNRAKRMNGRIMVIADGASPKLVNRRNKTKACLPDCHQFRVADFTYRRVRHDPRPGAILRRTFQDRRRDTEFQPAALVSRALDEHFTMAIPDHRAMQKIQKTESGRLGECCDPKVESGTCIKTKPSGRMVL
jgi:hypothetical protein